MGLSSPEGYALFVSAQFISKRKLLLFTLTACLFSTSPRVPSFAILTNSIL